MVEFMTIKLEPVGKYKLTVGDKEMELTHNELSILLNQIRQQLKIVEDPTSILRAWAPREWVAHT